MDEELERETRKGENRDINDNPFQNIMFSTLSTSYERKNQNSWTSDVDPRGIASFTNKYDNFLYSIACGEWNVYIKLI